jgi:hypothetical protein
MGCFTRTGMVSLRGGKAKQEEGFSKISRDESVIPLSRPTKAS